MRHFHSIMDALDVRALPTIHVGQYADLKIDTGTTRVWASRMTIADGETQPVQVERLVDGRWVDVTKPERGSLNDVELDGEYSGVSVRCITRQLASGR